VLNPPGQYGAGRFKGFVHEYVDVHADII